ncbi:MAG: helix-turn-helix domain-containing protein [Chloroflexota bacterium]
MKRDSEVLLMGRERAKGRSQEQAAARAGMSVRTLRRYERRSKLPSQLQEPRTYRTRPSPFAEDWPWIVSQLERDPALHLERVKTEAGPASGMLRSQDRYAACRRAAHQPMSCRAFVQVMMSDVGLG